MKTPHCECCGNNNKDILQLHHIKPIAHGGTNDKDNLIILCPNCHKKVHSGQIKDEELLQLKEKPKYFISPEQIQQNAAKLKQIEINMRKRIENQKQVNESLINNYHKTLQAKYEYIKKIQIAESRDKSINTKIQLLHYIDRMELKYESLEKQYIKLVLENQELKNELNNIEQTIKNPCYKKEKNLFHLFLDRVFGVA